MTEIHVPQGGRVQILTPDNALNPEGTHSEMRGKPSVYGEEYRTPLTWQAQ